MIFLLVEDSGTFEVVDTDSLSLLSWARWLLLAAMLKERPDISVIFELNM
jgi:hypothetical protein